MAKEKPKDKEDGKREKHIKKEKRSEKDGVHKIKKVKSEKKKNDAAEDRDVTTELVNALESKEPTGTAQDENDEAKVRVKIPPLLGALVPFAHPLADEKVQKKVFKGVKRGWPAFPPDDRSPVSFRGLFFVQRPNIDLSNAASKKSLSRCANHPPVLPPCPAAEGTHRSLTV
jgi:hypothetical protein